MIPIIISAEDYEPVTPKKLTEYGLQTEDAPDFLDFLMNCCPRYVNRSAERRGERIPLVKKLGDKPIWNGCVGVFRTLFPKENPKYNITIRVRSRFDTEDRHYFLATLIQSWVEKTTNSLQFEDVATNASWDEIFDFMSVAVFRRQVVDAYEAGIYRSYQYFEDNSERLRGSIDIPRHIRLNLGMNNGKIAMRYRENTPDNPMNHLILHTYSQLKQRHPRLVSALIEGDACGTVLDNLRYLAPSWSRTDPVAVAQKLLQPISNPLYDAYETLRDTCLRILDEQGAPLFEQGDTREDSILFYSPDLWENYIEHRIFSRLHGVSLQSQKEFTGLVTIRPDFVLSRGERRIVLDAKYKKDWIRFPDVVYPDDVRQCLIYHAILHAEYTGIIFPARTALDEKHRRARFSKYCPETNDSFQVIDVVLPPSDNAAYRSWRGDLTKEEQRIARRIGALWEEPQ